MGQVITITDSRINSFTSVLFFAINIKVHLRADEWKSAWKFFDDPGKKDVHATISFPKKLRMFFIVSHFRFIFSSPQSSRTFKWCFISSGDVLVPSIFLRAAMTCLLLFNCLTSSSVFDAKPLLLRFFCCHFNGERSENMKMKICLVGNIFAERRMKSLAATTKDFQLDAPFKQLPRVKTFWWEFFSWRRFFSLVCGWRINSAKKDSLFFSIKEIK